MNHQEILYAGAAKEDATPKVGTCLYGYRPNLASTSLHDPLSVTALALRQGEQTVLMLTAELGDLHTELDLKLRQELAEEHHIPMEHILFSSTHTHSAPNLSGVVGWGEIDREYYDTIFHPAVIKAARKALESLVPAEVAVGETKSEVGINRREQAEDGRIKLGQNPYGCYDPFMTVVAIREAENGTGILNLVHYGCHGTSAGANHEISRDWSGIMIDRMEKETGILTAFWNGAIGDVGPRLTNGKTTGDISYTEELGGVAATDAIRAYRQRGGYHSEVLQVFTGEVSVPNKEIMNRAEVEEKLASYENPQELVNIKRLEYEYYLMVSEFWKQENPKVQEYFTYAQTLVALGDILFVPFPFEMFSEITMRLRAYSGYRYTLSLSNTNGYHCYLPTESELCRGGYEVGCFRYIRTFQMADNADQHIIDENLRILRGEAQ